MANAPGIGQALNAANRVADVKATKFAWNLVVGVVHMCQLPCHNNPSDYYSVELILQDREGDRIQCSISKADFVVYSTLIREFGVYNMKGFIVQTPGRGVRTTSHKFKLSFYLKTCVSLLSVDAFPFSPFRITPFPGVVAITQAGQCYLIDCIGQVVSKEEIVDMVTHTGEASK
ncbi:hypothetical protein PIB30_037189 [Stylosanthes scabra]|uniref:Replication protein A 70 kDa DNA-binding subunit B/D first OB fold domain-containing protein n=1 Tax=Stylosanthes scabra TaxID=79078 RepID=A0ABU6WDR3_9FABA|nr:hypothetical protein [Stylosanthes scabra]